MPHFPRLPQAVAAALFAGAFAGCNDPVKTSEEQALAHTERLSKLADADVEELRRGLPVGAKKLGELLYGPQGPKDMDPRAVRGVMKKTREAVHDLQLAKATFFAVTDPAGVAIASDLDPDEFIGKDLGAAFPALKATMTAGGAYAEGCGELPQARGVRSGEDGQWAAAAPVAGPDGPAPKGAYVAGWSFRRFAYHLEQQLKSDLRNQAKGGGREPLLYVFVLVGDRAYGAPVTPEVNQKAVQGLGLVPKLQGDAPFRGRVDIAGRTFGVAARRAKALGEDCAVAVLRSEVLRRKLGRPPESVRSCPPAHVTPTDRPLTPALRPTRGEPA